MQVHNAGFGVNRRRRSCQQEDHQAVLELSMLEAVKFGDRWRGSGSQPDLLICHSENI